MMKMISVQEMHWKITLQLEINLNQYSYAPSTETEKKLRSPLQHFFFQELVFISYFDFDFKKKQKRWCKNDAGDVGSC